MHRLNWMLFGFLISNHSIERVFSKHTSPPEAVQKFDCKNIKRNTFKASASIVGWNQSKSEWGSAELGQIYCGIITGVSGESTANVLSLCLPLNNFTAGRLPSVARALIKRIAKLNPLDFSVLLSSLITHDWGSVFVFKVTVFLYNKVWFGNVKLSIDFFWQLQWNGGWR